jgi:hypothetical protein
MDSSDIFLDGSSLNRDLMLLENLQRSRKEFFDRLCEASTSQEEQVLATLRLEGTYQFAEFFYLLRARGILSEEQVETLAELHNQYIVDLMKDQPKIHRLGLNKERVLDAMFTADTLPRLLQNWRERPGAIDQSNLARFLAVVMSSETCRKIVVAGTSAGFLDRIRTPYGTILVSSKGILEAIFGGCIRDLRLTIEGA